MFQNIAEKSKHNGNYNDNINNVKYRLREIFKYQNIVIYVLTFLISTLSVKNEIAPFGLAMVAACVGETIPIVGVFVSAMIGTLVGSGVSALGNFLLTSIIYFALITLFNSKVAVDERNEVIKTGGKLFLSCLIIPLIKSFMDVFLVYDVFMAVVASSLTYVFYKIFVNGLVIIENFNEKKAFTIEELIGSVIIIAIASTVFRNVSVFSLSVNNIIIIFMIMVLGWKYGMMIGTVSGISIGLAISFVGDTSIVQIAMFAISGILSGALSRFGKIGVIAGFILGNCILTYWVRGASNMIIYFREIFVASIGLLLMPKKINLKIEDLMGTDKLISDVGENRLTGGNDEVSEKLKSVSDLFKSLTTEPDKEKIMYEENLYQDFLDNLEDINTNMFYDEIANEDNEIAKDICTILLKNDIILDNDLVRILENHNNYVFLRDQNTKDDLQEIIKIANRTLKAAQIDKIRREEKQKAIKEVNQNLKNASKIIDDCNKEIKDAKGEYTNKEKELEILFKNKGLKIENIKIRKLKNEKIIVDLNLDYNDNRLKEKAVMTNICDVISKSIGNKMALQREKLDENEKEYHQIYSSEDKFVLQVGSSRITKDGSNVSGDCSLQIKLVDGKYLLAIADGMGTGEKARECSKITLKLLKQMMAAGFENEDTIKLLNDKMNLINKTEMYSTLDATVLDLYTGKAEIIKNGASNTYIKNKKSIKKIKSESLPIGIIENVELQKETINIADGDILVMCSDGVLDTKENNDDWLEKFLKNVNTNNVQKLADLILAEAIDNNYGVAGDDMTVIVSKIISRK